MKVIKAKRRARIDTKSVDELAQEYLAAKEVEKAASSAEKRLNEKVKTTARVWGVVRGKDTLVEGKKFEIGFTRCDNTEGIDPVVAKKLLPPEVYRACLVPVINGDKVAEFVERGEVDLKTLNKMRITIRMGAERIIVRPRTEKEKI
jgi:hypothetical protein